MSNRREFITLVGGAAAWPFAVRAQQPTPMVGFLSSTARSAHVQRVPPFLQGLKDAGFIEGQNVQIAFRWAENDYDRLPALAADLINQQVAVIAADSPGAVAAKVATTAIPFVFNSGTDPIQLGLVASLNRPGGNVTGMGTFNTGLGAKSVELLKELVPAAAVIAYLVNPSNPSAEIYSKEAVTAASALGIQVHVLNASTERDLDEAFASLAKLGAGGLVVMGEPFFDSQRDRIVALSARYSVAAIYTFREYVVAGGLMSYGSSLPNSYRRAGIYVGRVLKGEKPADLPVMQPTKFHLALNLKTAKALGLQVPATLLARADEVIE